MKTIELHPRSAALGLVLGVVGLLAVGATARQSPARQSPTKWEYKLTERVDVKSLKELGDAGWEYAGYLGESKLGEGEALGLWKRPK